MKYCYNCGNQLIDDANFCPLCGHPQTNQSQFSQNYSHPPNNAVDGMLTKISERIKTNGIIWIVVGALQIVLGLFANWYFLAVGILNLISALQDINYSGKILQNPSGIVANALPLVRPIISLIYNLVIGGIMGIAGSVYYFVAVRGFIIENKQHFIDLEQNYNNQ